MKKWQVKCYVCNRVIDIIDEELSLEELDTRNYIHDEHFVYDTCQKCKS